MFQKAWNFFQGVLPLKPWTTVKVNFLTPQAGPGWQMPVCLSSLPQLPPQTHHQHLTNVTLQRELRLSDSRLGHSSPFSTLSLSIPSFPPLTFIPFLHQVLSTFLNTSFLASWAQLSLKIILQDSWLWAQHCKALFLHPAPTRCLHIHREGIHLA